MLAGPIDIFKVLQIRYTLASYHLQQTLAIKYQPQPLFKFSLINYCKFNNNVTATQCFATTE
jgi:hypothetical protein